MVDFWIIVDFWIMGDSWIMGDFWIMGDSWIMGDFSIMGDGGQTHKHTDKQTDGQTHQYHDLNWPKGRAEWKKKKQKSQNISKNK